MTQLIGRIYATIDGDYRYSSALVVKRLDDGTVSVTRDDGAPAGGMDSFTPSVSMNGFRRVLRADVKPADLVDAIKAGCDDVIRRYGKPSKRFKWCTGEVGISAAKAKAALAATKPE
jgi:hypothetical protein